jgi:peptidoglycan/LPS O-acetylase OafA/YrhL
MGASGKIHFHTFDALRFFAFLKVFLFHLPNVLPGDPAMEWFRDHIKHGGGVGVSFFFVLSGFLITYILTYEKLNTGKIDLKRFFVRRAFRIWPLFYLVVIIVLLLPPDFAQHWGLHMNGGGYDPDWRFSLTFTENYKSIIMDSGPKLTPLPVFWSLCIEEHFYIIWMIVFFFIRPKGIPCFLGATVLIAWIFRFFETSIYGTENFSTNDLFTNIDYFAISGLLGYAVAKNYRRVADLVIRIPYAIRIGYIFAVLTLLYFQKDLFVHHDFFPEVLKYTLFSTVFAGLLIVFIPQEKGGLRIRDKHLLSWLGRISYGLYVYHLVWIHVLMKVFKYNGWDLNHWSTFGLFVLITFSGTVLTSAISYYWFEKPILSFRETLFPKKAN